MRALFVATVLACAILGITASPALAKSYEMTSLTIDATVTPDGALHVREQRVFDFSGDFTFVFWELDKWGL